jgi:hypothetical protein
MLNNFKKWIQTNVDLPLIEASPLDRFKDLHPSIHKPKTSSLIGAIVTSQPGLIVASPRSPDAAKLVSVKDEVINKSPSSSSPCQARRPSARIDLSHLNAAEQAHIAAVLERAKVEEYEVDEMKDK